MNKQNIIKVSIITIIAILILAFTYLYTEMNKQKQTKAPTLQEVINQSNTTNNPLSTDANKIPDVAKSIINNGLNSVNNQKVITYLKQFEIQTLSSDFGLIKISEDFYSDPNFAQIVKLRSLFDTNPIYYSTSAAYILVNYKNNNLAFLGYGLYDGFEKINIDSVEKWFVKVVSTDINYKLFVLNKDISEITEYKIQDQTNLNKAEITNSSDIKITYADGNGAVQKYSKTFKLTDFEIVPPTQINSYFVDISSLSFNVS